MRLHTLKSVLMKLVLIVGGCTIFVLIVSTTFYLGHAYGLFPEAPPMRWRQFFFQQIVVWYPVALLSLGIEWLGRRFRLERRSWLRALPIHLAFTILFHIIHTLTAFSILRLIEGESLIPRPFLSYYATRVVGRLALGVIVYWSILGASYAFEYYRKFREQELQASRLRAQLVEAQLDALKMQLHPHFLFNTLHAISALMDEDVRAARRMIARLGELLRLTLENAGQQEIALKEELEMLGRYLEVEQIRFQDRLQVRMAIAPETLVASVPNLILQPIVENAIKYGIAPSLSAGVIEIVSVRKDGRIELQVSDDGPGLRTSNGDAFKEGIGLSNTRERLRQLYGENHNFEIRNGEKSGLVVTLSIPFHSLINEFEEK